MKRLTFCCTVAALIGTSSFAQTTEATDTVLVTAAVAQQPPSITVTPETVDFGTLDPSTAGVNRFLSGTATCSWVAPTDTDKNWWIEVTTANTQHFPGLVDINESLYLPLKFNHAGLGDNDPNVEANWTGNTATFLWVFDTTDDGAGHGSDGFASKFTQNDDQPDIGELDFQFAVEVANDAYPTSYSAIITFDLVVEALP